MRIVWRNGHIGYFTDMAVTPLLLLAVAVLTASSSVWVHGAIAGALLWQPFEWATHRYVLHGLVRGQHWAHHREPTGDAGVPPVFTQPLLWALLAAAVLGLGAQLGGGLFFGFGFGYWTYNLVHWMIHANLWPTGLLGGVARRHALHHRGVAANFNVLIPLCDMAFGTYRRA